jgi:DNA-binding transcriptional LysR family regulator
MFESTKWMTLARHFFGELQARTMDQLAEMRVFVRAIERGTFAGAASDLGLTPSAVSKLIARLEGRLGVRLINRTTRKLSLTAEGQTYFHSGQRLVEAVDGLEHEVSASAGHPRGLLRVNTAVSFGVQHLAPALIEFHQRYPEVRVNLSLTDRPVDLHTEQIDIGVRLGPLDDSSLMSRKITEIERALCASPGYVERFGAPQTAAELVGHRCIVFSSQGRARWPFRTADGGVEQLQISGTFASDSLACILEWALQGAGIARLPDFMVAAPIRERKLIVLLAEEHHPARTPAFAVFPPGTQKIPRVRAFLDFMVERFGRDLPRLGEP